MKTMKIKILTLAVFTVLGSQIAPVYAFPITLDIDAETTVTQYGSTDANSASSSTFAQSYSESSGDIISYANSRGRDDGWFYANAFGNGELFDSMGVIKQTATVTNDTAVDQLINFDFTINFGSLNVNTFGPDPAFASDESVTSLYSAEILLNGSVLWNSSASITYDENGYEFSQSGTSLATYDPGNPSFYSWGKQTDSIDLGLVGAGSNFVLEYIVKTHSFGNSAIEESRSCEDYGEYGTSDGSGPETSQVDDGYGCFYSLAEGYAQFGDPFSFNNQPLISASNFQPRSTAVAEPATTAILGAGLVGLAFMRRKKAAHK
jgi:hypothetical protein